MLSTQPALPGSSGRHATAAVASSGSTNLSTGNASAAPASPTPASKNAHAAAPAANRQLVTSTADRSVRTVWSPTPTISKSASTAVAAVRSASAALVGQSGHRRPRARSRDERNKLTHKHLNLKASSTRSETPATVSPTTRSSFASRSPPCRRPTSRCETNETATAWPAKRSLARCTC